MGVYSHQAEGLGHGTSLPYVPTPFTRDQLSPAMQARYGLDRRPIGRWLAVALLVLGFVGVLVFVTVGLSSNPVEARLVTFEVVSAERADARVTVQKPADEEVVCVLRAQDEIRVDVGYATVVLPPGESDVLLDYSLRTLAPAFTVELLGCSVDGPPGVSPPQFPPGVVPPTQPY